MRRIALVVLVAVLGTSGCRCACGGESGTDAAPGTDASPPGTDALPPGTDALPPGTDAAPPSTDAGPAAVTLACWDASRGGAFYASGGADFATARANIEAEFSVTWVELADLAGLATSGAQGVVLSAIASGAGGITPLSPSEQTALAGFVTAGGFAILLADNDVSFDASSDSLVAPFGLTASGTIPADDTGTVTMAHPITAGVTTFDVGWPTSISDPGATGLVLGTTALGPLIVVIEEGALAPGSGVVVIFGDGTPWHGGWVLANSAAHTALLLQALHHASGL